MRNFQNAYPNDGYTNFDKEYACWANNHNGWRKAKKKWRKIGKKKYGEDTSYKISAVLFVVIMALVIIGVIANIVS